ncbi:MAG: hypothetical protein RMJ54_18985, partial [Roseiflexaceae bacterium]|nr:hypothetical protein [Roseiflexaceae bacterium]
MNPKRLTSIFIILLFAITACAGLPSSNVQTATPHVGSIRKSTETPVSAASPTPVPTQAQPTAAPIAAKGTYLINRRATSTHSAFESVNLVIYRATLTDDRLTLRVG